MSNDIEVTTLDLLRHGECADGDIFRGRTDSLLSELGHQQMQRAIDLSGGGWDVIVTSPLQRCRAFSQTLASTMGLSFNVEDGLQEISFGDWDGLTRTQINAQNGDRLAAYWLDRENNTPPNGEPLAEFHQRTHNALRQLLDSERGRHLLIVTHGGVVRSFIAHCLQIPLKSISHIDVPYGCQTQIQVFHSPYHSDWMQLMHHNPLPR